MTGNKYIFKDLFDKSRTTKLCGYRFITFKNFNFTLLVYDMNVEWLFKYIS